MRRRAPSVWRMIAQDAREWRQCRPIRFPNLCVRREDAGKYQDVSDYGNDDYVLAGVEAVKCPNVELWPNKYQSQGSAWIEWRECRRCQHYKPGTRSRTRKPMCMWMWDRRKDKQYQIFGPNE